MKYFIKTFGCQMNFSDSERMATFFEENNFQPTSKISEAGLIVFNTCGVRQMAEDRVYGQVHNIYKKYPKKTIVVTGCLAHREDFRKRLEAKVDLFLSIKDIPNILKLLKTSQKTNSASHFHTPENESGYNNDYLEIQPKYEKENSALVPIMTGCNNFCTYCIVPYARGREWSRPFKDIETEIQKLANKNYKEITLLGQNVNSYLSAEALAKEDKDGGKPATAKATAGTVTFPVLLDKLAKEFPKVKFNFLTSHPKDYSDELIKVIKENQNISREIHLPVQSGSDKILKAMNRPYTQKHYLNLIKKTKEQIPGVKFSTDVIVGFPGETEEDFGESVKVFKEVGYFEAYVNKYSPRPGTASFKLEDNVPLEEKKRREKELRKYF